MDVPRPSPNEIDALWEESESPERFFSALDARVRASCPTTFTHERDGAGTVTIVSGVHGGPDTGDRLRETIRDRNPDFVAVELGRLNHLRRRLFASADSPAECDIGIHEADAIGATSVGIDKSELWLTMMKARHATGYTRTNAVLGLLRRAFDALAGVASLGLLALGEWLPAVFFGLLALWAFFEPFRTAGTPRDAGNREYALLAIGLYAKDVTGPRPLDSYMIESRDEHMARRIERLRERGDVVVSVGYGHVPGLLDHIDPDESAWDMQEATGVDA